MAKSRLTKRQRKRLRKTLAALGPPLPTPTFDRSLAVAQMKELMARGLVRLFTEDEAVRFPSLAKFLSEAHGKS